jgi:hypothetical protein
VDLHFHFRTFNFTAQCVISVWIWAARSVDQDSIPDIDERIIPLDSVTELGVGFPCHTHHTATEVNRGADLITAAQGSTESINQHAIKIIYLYVFSFNRYRCKCCVVNYQRLHI